MTIKEQRNRLGRSETPEGINSLPSNELFYERKYYKEEIYPESNLPSQNFWYKNPLYGLINRKAEPVYPTESALKQFKASDTLLALNFVVDAFEDLRNFIDRFVALGRIETVGSPYIKIEPVAAWSSIHQSFDVLMESHYDQFYTSWSRRKSRDLKMNSFQQFMGQFSEYLLKVVHQFPITRSSFTVSTMNTPYCSGLIIDIKDLNNDDDRPKKERFIDDPNFEFFRISANKHGFMVDENAPWRLIADIGSSAMKRYMEPYGITFDNLFDSYYYRAELTDLEAFKSYFKLFYESYVEAVPDVRFLARSKNSGKLEQQVKRRKITSPESISDLDNSFWLPYYIKFKLAELRINNIIIGRLVDQIITIDRKLGSEKALNYLYKQIGGFKTIAYPTHREKLFN